MPNALVALREIALTELCRLNNQFGTETSLLTENGMSRLIGMAFYAFGVAGESAQSIDAMLIALDQTAPYENENLHFFQKRHVQFVYVDRMITASHAQRRGLGRSLYEEMFKWARGAGQPVVCCEVNLDPPNPASDAFHERLGFVEVGQARLKNGKFVRYLELRLG